MNKAFGARILRTGSAIGLIACLSAASNGPACVTQIDTPEDGGSLAPYALEKFQAALDNTRSLQVQNTSTCLSNARIREHGFVPENWRLHGEDMEFVFSDGVRGERVELRGHSFAGDASREFRSMVRLEADGSSPTFTIAQIFGQDTSDPILRIEFEREFRGLRNHLWAVYRTDTGDAERLYSDLGPAPVDEAQELILRYNIEGAVTARLGDNPQQSWSTNLDFWTRREKSTYFKAGCYLQRAGDCRVLYSELSF